MNGQTLLAKGADNEMKQRFYTAAKHCHECRVMELVIKIPMFQCATCNVKSCEACMRNCHNTCNNKGSFSTRIGMSMS
jgi:hypothetical protein